MFVTTTRFPGLFRNRVAPILCSHPNWDSDQSRGLTPEQRAEELEAAFHETWHLFMAIMLGHRVDQVEIRAEPWASPRGARRFTTIANWQTMPPADRILISLAGEVGRLAKRGERYEPGKYIGALADERAIYEVLRDPKDLEAAIARVERMVALCWPAADELVQELLRFGCLSGRYIENFIERRRLAARE